QFALYHNRYNLPCETPVKSTAYSGWKELEKALIKQHDIAFIVPVYMYDHGSLSFHVGYNRPYPFNDRWDSGMVGFAFVTKSMVKNVFGWQRVSDKRKQWLLDYMRAEMETYQYYANGQVYGYTIDSDDADSSCGGCYGYDSARLEAHSYIDYIIKMNVITLEKEIHTCVEVSNEEFFNGR
ncbi:hypothetical protein IH575_04590, partial [Candidatus Dojkabacteria bacterium]|nr:hypothetical protein [Candidatus Dojkabacteria bacterium]